MLTRERSEFASHPKWEFWNVDLEARNGEPLEGIPENTGAYTPIKLDGRLFVKVPGSVSCSAPRCCARGAGAQLCDARNRMGRHTALESKTSVPHHS